MPENQSWIEEQKANRMFRGGGRGNDADRMLEYSLTNRWNKEDQAQMIIGLRLMSKTMSADCLEELCVMVEKAQLCMDSQSRRDFMHVAIEQWQGKLANIKHKTLDILT